MGQAKRFDDSVQSELELDGFVSLLDGLDSLFSRTGPLALLGFGSTLVLVTRFWSALQRFCRSIKAITDAD